MSYQIITDGAWDFSTESSIELGVEVIPYYVSLDQKTYKREVFDVPVREIYEFMADNPGSFPKTSLPSISDYTEAFTKYAKKGMDIICCTLSRKFSGSYNSAVVARDIILETYSKIRIEVVDTIQATLMQGLIVKEMALAQKSGVTYDNVLKIADIIKRRARIFFTVGNMDYLIHGGRVGKLAGISANILKISPLICLYGGELQSAGLAHGRQNAKKKVLEMLISYVKELGGDISQYSFMTGYGYDISEGSELKESFLKRMTIEYPGADIEIDCAQIGATIGVHTGPYPIGFGVIDKWDSVDID